MSQVITNETAYRQVHPNSMYELQFESLIEIHAPSMFQNHYVIPFKKLLKTPLGGVIPDLALINKDLNRWAIVEVEMCYHSYESHIHPQLEKLMSAKTQSDSTLHSYLVEKVIKVAPEIDHSKLMELLSTSDPDIMVFLNEPCDELMTNIRRLGIDCLVLELFGTPKLPRVFRLDGSFPNHKERHIANLQPHPIANNTFLLEMIDTGYIIDAEPFFTRFEDRMCQWQTHVTSSGTVLIPQGRCPWSSDKSKKLYVIGKNEYYLI